MSFLHAFVEGSRSAFFDGETLPVMVADHLSQVDDLADVVGIMGELPVDGVDDHQGFVPDRDRFEEVFVLE